ncbi:MAG: aldehyde dehydrogenase family protein, partial [Bacteroidia bacterium]
MNSLASLKQQQLAFFQAGHTRSLRFRKSQLKALKKAITQREEAIVAALASDLGKPQLEAYAAEVGFIYQEIDKMLRQLPSHMQAKRVPSPIALFPSQSWVQREPLGQVLIIGPWNYPFQLLLAPLVGALAAGNTVLLKPSEFTPAINAVLRELIAANYEPSLVAIIEGDGPEIMPTIF